MLQIYVLKGEKVSKMTSKRPLSVFVYMFSGRLAFNLYHFAIYTSVLISNFATENNN